MAWTFEFLGDYSHALKPWQILEKPFLDRWLRRSSVVYRLALRRFRPEHIWAPMGSALARPEAYYWQMDPARPRSRDPGTLAIYRRNIETIIELALLRGIKPVLTTQPYSRDPNAAFAVNAEHIEQCNAILREIAAAFGERIAFVDLDALMVGRFEEVFIDVAHVDEKGRRFKARRIAATIAGPLGDQSATGASR